MTGLFDSRVVGVEITAHSGKTKKHVCGDKKKNESLQWEESKQNDVCSIFFREENVVCVFFSAFAFQGFSTWWVRTRDWIGHLTDEKFRVVMISQI